MTVTRAGLLIESGQSNVAATELVQAVRDSATLDVCALWGRESDRVVAIWKGALDAVRMMPQPNLHRVEELMQAFSALGLSIKASYAPFDVDISQNTVFRTLCHLASDLCVYVGDYSFLRRKLEDAGHSSRQAAEISGRMQDMMQTARSQVEELVGPSDGQVRIAVDW